MASPMTDDDIEYLGARLNVSDNPLYPRRTLTGRPLSLSSAPQA